MHLQYSNTVPLRLTVYANRICSQCDVLWQFRLPVINFSLPWYAATICFVLTQFWPPETRNLYQLFFFPVHYSSHEDLISVCFYIYVKCACVLLCKYTHVLFIPINIHHTIPCSSWYPGKRKHRCRCAAKSFMLT